MSKFETLPHYVKRVDAQIALSVLDLLDGCIIHTPIDGVKFPLPKGMNIVAINDGFIHSEVNFESLGRLINEFSNEGAFFFFPYANSNEVFQSEFSFEVMDWIETVILENPVIFFVSGLELVIVIDDQLSISVIGFKSCISPKVSKILGNCEVLRSQFESSITKYYTASGEREKRWLEKFSLTYCDW